MRALRRARNQFGLEAEREKRRLLAAIAKKPPKGAAALLLLHEDLLFLRAFPGEKATRAAAVKMLDGFEKWIVKLSRAERAIFDDTGVAGSTTRHVFPFPVAERLASRARGEAEIDWRNYEDPSKLDRALFSFMRPAELEAAESGAMSTREVVNNARSANSVSDFDWVVGAMSARGVDQKTADANWNEAEAPVLWNLSGSRFSTTRNALAGAPIVLRQAMRRPPADPVARIFEPMQAIELLPRAPAQKVIELAQTALAARCREVVAITYPNPDEVHWCDLGAGVNLAIIGVAPRYRLNLESNTGYLLLSNGVPIGYGGVTPFYRQANTGINIFDPFRGSEAAFLWMEMLRAFHSVYGSRRFVINGYQFGEGNSEAIGSGAYWFYYRLGFRPEDAAQRKLAAKEAARLAKPGAAPSGKATLRALAKGDLILEAPDFDSRDALDETLLVKASEAAMKVFSSAPAHARGEAEDLIAEKTAKALGVSSMSDWPREEQRSFARLAPIVSAVEGAENWPPAEKRAVVEMLRCKGRPQERDFAIASTRCERFFRALAATRG